MTTPYSAASPRHVRDVRAGHHRLGRNAPRVYARAAEEAALDHRHFHAGLGQSAGQRRTGLTRPYNNRVELSHAPRPSELLSLRMPLDSEQREKKQHRRRDRSRQSLFHS